jgi:hypothetical protein
MAKKANNDNEVTFDRITGSIHLPEEETPLDKIFGENKDPLYTSKSSIEDMGEKNIDFYAKTTETAFERIMEDEKEKLNDLVNATYMPVFEERQETDIEILTRNLNIVR